MKSVRYYIAMWLAFAFVFIIATLGLEILEGNKITTTAYYGLRNLGITFVIWITLFMFAVYLITFLPLSIIIHKIVKPFIPKVILFTFIGGVSGILVFEYLYGFGSANFIKAYDLEKSNAVVIFGLAGLLYSVIDNFIRGKAKLPI